MIVHCNYEWQIIRCFFPFFLLLLLSRDQSCVLLQVPSTTVNGGIHTERKVGNRDRERNRVGSGESEHESLLVHENTPKYVRHKQLQLCTEQGKRHRNEFLAQFMTRLMCARVCVFFGIADEGDINGAAASGSRNALGNNNYELTEFDTRGPTYRYV